MKKIIMLVLVASMFGIYAAEPRPIIVGMLDASSAEYDNTTITGVTYKAWLTQGTGPACSELVIRQNDGLTGCKVEMYPDPVTQPIRGTSQVNLQWFEPWAPDNVFNILMKDENGGLKTYFEGSYSWVIDSSANTVEIGFQDYGFGIDNPIVLGTPSSIEGNNVPVETKLHQNYPNPFNPTTTIKFDLASDSNVKLNVYNYNGQMVQSLVDGQMNAGVHTVDFDASNLCAGVYFYALEANSSVFTNKMILVK